MAMSYIFRVSVHIPSWIQVLITYDRYITVVYPKRFKFNKDKRKLGIIILVIVIFILIIDSENFWMTVLETTTIQNVTVNMTAENVTSSYTITQISVSKVCSSTNKALVLFRDMIAAVFRSVLPFIFMLVGNVLLTKAFFESKSKAQAVSLLTIFSPTKTSTSSAMRKEIQFAVSIFVMNLLFMIVYTPLAVYLFRKGIFAYNPSLASPTLIAANHLGFNISIWIAFLNNTFPFFINLKFNKLFQQEFKSVLIEMKLLDIHIPESPISMNDISKKGNN